jgi:predicted AAA+ superfamily ATPase
MYNRSQIFQGLGKESAFLWGARQTGKSTLLKAVYPEAPYFDLLRALNNGLLPHHYLAKNADKLFEETQTQSYIIP